MNLENIENQNFNDAVIEAVQIMCRIFWGPDLEYCSHMMEDNFLNSFEIIFRGSHEKPFALVKDIKTIINKFDSQNAFYDHLNECYVKLFVNNRQGIVAPLYESCYEFDNAPMMGKAAVEMTLRFKSKNLSMEITEPPDHLAVELEYLFFLLQEKNELISDEAKVFAEKTMLPWIMDFNKRLKSVDDDCRFYYFSSQILILLLEQISKK